MSTCMPRTSAPSSRARREHHLVVGEPKFGKDGLRQVEHSEDLVRELLGQAEDVSIVLREAPHAEEAVQRARALVPVDSPELGPAQGEVAVRARAVLVDEHVEGAVHRPNLVLRALDLHLVGAVVGARDDAGRARTGSEGQKRGGGRRARGHIDIEGACTAASTAGQHGGQLGGQNGGPQAAPRAAAEGTLTWSNIPSL